MLTIIPPETVRVPEGDSDREQGVANNQSSLDGGNSFCPTAEWILEKACITSSQQGQREFNPVLMVETIID